MTATRLAFTSTGSAPVTPAGRRARGWLESKGVEIESGARRLPLLARLLRLFFYDPDGIKLEIVHRSRVRAVIRR